MKKQFHLTQEGYDELAAELKTLVDRRSQLAEDIETARSQGDLAENAEYHAAREEQGYAEDRIKQIEHIIKTASVVDSVKSNGVVQVGSFVEIKKKGERVSKKIEIVGGEESDMLSGKVSYKGPLGSALLGQVMDSSVSVVTPKGEMTYKIVSVS